MISVFTKFYKHVLLWEGGSKLHKVKGDSGGWTLYGIAYNKNKHLFKSLDDFKSMDYDRAAKIAYENYYKPIKTELLPIESQLFYFDMAYNMGNSRAIKILQKCIGVKQDGIIGEITKSKIPKVKLDCLYENRNKWYRYLKDNTSWGGKFYKGWMNRSNDIYKKSKEIKIEGDEKQDNKVIDRSNNSDSGSVLGDKQQEKQPVIQGAAKEPNYNYKERFIAPFIRWFIK